MLSRRITLASVIAVFLLVALAGAGCDRGDPGVDGDVVFGEGSLPASFPRDFPVPPNAAIGTTLVDRVNNRTEVNLTVRADMTSAVQFFQVGLVNQGYVVDRSEGDRARWTIEFLRGEMRGEIGLNVSGSTALVSITMNTS